MQGDVNDRYEPLPGFFELPRWLWRKMPPAAKVAVAALGVGLVVLAIVLSPVIQRSKEDRAREEAALSAEHQRQLLDEIQREQRPRFARGAPAGTDIPKREQLVASAGASIQADASRRSAAGEFNGPILRVSCEPYPRGGTEPPADQVPSKANGIYSCLAITSDIPETEGSRGGVVGHPYRTKIDFGTGRYAFCKIRGRPGELAIRTDARIQVPRACGG
jgi:hypothetical protein